MAAGEAARPPQTFAPAARTQARMPTMPWLAAAQPGSTRSNTASTALGATASVAPAALSHVAWADRWLARFAGATPQSLDVLQAASAGTPEQRMQALAAAAPGEVFVAPIFDTETMRTGRAMPVEAAPFGDVDRVDVLTRAPRVGASDRALR